MKDCSIAGVACSATEVIKGLKDVKNGLSAFRYLKVGNDINSYTCFDCNRGKISQAEDTICKNCTVGLFQPDTGKGSCRPCEAGTWSNTVGSSSSSNCQKCKKGTYSSAEGATNINSCNACPPGKKSQVLGATSNQACQACELSKI